MDGALLHDFVETLIWPGIFVVAFFVFRRQFSGLLDRLSKLTWGDVSLELKEKIESLEATAKRVENERESDDDAIAMVDVQLSETLSPPFDETTLIESIKKASPVALETIYRHAKTVRKDAWSSLQQKRAAHYNSEQERDQDIAQSVRWMERTIPIFRALTELGHRQRWHRYYAQLGYALKDTGRIEEAGDVLEKAIEEWIRQTGKPVSPHYRYNWVYCAVRLDNAAHPDGAPSDAQTRDAIRTGLREGSRFPALSEALRSDPQVQAWLERNGLTLSWLYDDAHDEG